MWLHLEWLPPPLNFSGCSLARLCVLLYVLQAPLATSLPLPKSSLKNESQNVTFSTVFSLFHSPYCKWLFKIYIFLLKCKFFALFTICHLNYGAKYVLKGSNLHVKIKKHIFRLAFSTSRDIVISPRPFPSIYTYWKDYAFWVICVHFSIWKVYTKCTFPCE